MSSTVLAKYYLTKPFVFKNKVEIMISSGIFAWFTAQYSALKSALNKAVNQDIVLLLFD